MTSTEEEFEGFLEGTIAVISKYATFALGVDDYPSNPVYVWAKLDLKNEVDKKVVWRNRSYAWHRVLPSGALQPTSIESRVLDFIYLPTVGTKVK